MVEYLKLILNTIKNINVFNVLDIAVVSFIFYKIYNLIRGTRAQQLLKGILLIFLLIPISDTLHLTTLNWILNETITIGVLTIVIIFQPEIRRALEHIGRSAFTERLLDKDEELRNQVVDEVVTAVSDLAKTKTGALIIFERKTGLGEVISTGTKIDAVVSAALLENIFVVNTPLHDGATIVRDNRIVASGCFLPLTDDKGLNKQLGTRHRAAIGLSETSDALVIVVSEETGTISIALNGKLIRNYDKEKLQVLLNKMLSNNNNKKMPIREKVKSLWKKKKDNN